MVETLAAFTVLAVILVMLFHIVKFSNELRMLAVDSAHLNQMFAREVYKTPGAMDSAFVGKNYYGKTGEKTFYDVFDESNNKEDKSIVTNFYLVLDEEKTDMDSYYAHLNKGPDQEGGGYFKLKLNCLSAVGYFCKDSIVNEEKITRPSLMNFIYTSPETETETEP